MTATLQRGFGGRKDILILVVTLLIGGIAVALALLFRQQIHAPPREPPAGLSAAELLAQAGAARGPELVRAYTRGGLITLVAPAIGRNARDEWVVLPTQWVLEIRDATITGGETWLQGRVQSRGAGELVTVHASFARPYRPVPLDEQVELSGVKLLRIIAPEQRRVAVGGQLRNRGVEPLTQCVVAASFLDAEDNELDMKRASVFELPPGELIEFQTLGTTVSFVSVSLQISHQAAGGARRYLANVVIPRGAE